MSDFTPHALAGEHRPDVVLPIHGRCVSLVDLPGVAAGTPGKVMVASGLVWRRYRVRFEDGTEVGSLDARHIGPAPGRSPRHH